MRQLNLILSHDNRFNFVGVTFEETLHTGRSKVYYYKTVEKFEVGDQCLVDASGTLKVVEIAEINCINKVDGKYRYKWVIQKIDLAAYEEHMEVEEKIMDRINEMERAKIRQDFKEQMVDILGIDGVDEVNKLVKL